MHWTKEIIEQTDRKLRLNVINSITGIKPANLIGTRNTNGGLNLAIFNSVFHLGSDPGLIGLIMRPTGDVPRHTYENILLTEQYTINAIRTDQVEQAHYTSAKFDSSVDEFERLHFQPKYLENFDAPFVDGSPIQIGLQLEQVIPIVINQTKLIIGSIQHLMIDDELVNDKGYLDLEKAKVAGIGGLNTYYELKEIGQFPYARVANTPSFTKE